MEKSWRIQRYQRKDYSELVEFPVEIVGRDGVVRRYTFEDSIRLYRRRITFAPIRYRDLDLVQAEVDHCRSRIEQLRRSFFYRYGWGTPEGETPPVDLFGSIAGEIAAFLSRILKSEGRIEVRFAPIVQEVGADASDIASISTWFVVPRESDSGMLLYVHRFDQPDAEEVRERFFALLKQLEHVGRAGDDGERLVAFHHTVDCGFIVTARGSDFSGLVVQREEELDEPPTHETTPWDEVLEIIRRGAYTDALARCRQLVAEQPWHKSAYLGGAILALHLEQPLVAEELALVGSRYFPTDALLRFYTGLARARQGRRREAIDPLAEATRLAPELSCARLLLAVLLLGERRYSAARRALRGRWGGRPDDRRADALMARVEQWMFWRALMVATGNMAALLGVTATALAGWFGFLPLGLGLVMSATGMYAFRRELDRIASWNRFEDLGHGLRRLRKGAAGGTAAS